MIVDARRHARTEGREGVEALRVGVLRPLLLELAGGDVVEAGEPEHVVPRVRLAHVMRAPADHDADFRFVVDAPDPAGQQDRVARPDHRRRRLDEHQRILRQGLSLLRRVILVVEADADHLRRRDRRQEAVRVARDFVPRLVGAEQLALEEPPRPGVGRLDDVTRRAVVVDTEELLHLAVSCTRFEGALLLGGVARSTATIA